MSLKRSAVQAGLEEEAFPFSTLLPEMKMEITQRMTPHTFALFALTNKEHLAKYGHMRLPTLTLLKNAAELGNYDLFRELEDYFDYPFVDEPLYLLEIAIKEDRPEFVQAFLQEKNHVLIALEANLNAYNKLLDHVSRYASWRMAKIFLALVDKNHEVSPQTGLYTAEVYAALRRLLHSAVLYSNISLLYSLRKEAGNFLASQGEGDKRNAFLTAWGSCQRETIDLVSHLFDLDFSLVNQRFVVIPNDSPPLTPEYLQFMKDNRCSPSASAVICNALKYKNERLFNFSLNDIKCKLRDHERALVAFKSPEHEPLFRRLYANEEFLGNKRPFQQLKAGATKEGVDFFLEKKLLDPLWLQRASSETTPDLLFYLAEKNFPIQFPSLLNCAIRHDNKNALLKIIDRPEMFRGQELCALLARYNSSKLIPLLVDRSYYTIPDAVQQIVSTLTTINAPHPWPISNAGGLRQLYTSLRWLLFQAKYPLDADGKKVLPSVPPPFLVSNVLLSLSALKLGDSPFIPFLVEKIYSLLTDPKIPHIVLHSETLWQCVLQARKNEQPAEFIELLKKTAARLFQ